MIQFLKISFYFNTIYDNCIIHFLKGFIFQNLISQAGFVIYGKGLIKISEELLLKFTLFINRPFKTKKVNIWIKKDNSHN